MKEEIILNLENPRALEKLYRDNKANFKKDFNLIYNDIQDNPIARCWHERLNFEADGIVWSSKPELIFVIAVSFLVGLTAKLVYMADIKTEYFYGRNIGFLVLPVLAAYFLWKQKSNLKKSVVVAITTLAAAIYINLLPSASQLDDTLILACLHLPLFLWVMLGYSFVGEGLNDVPKRLDFLRYNGDLVIICTIIVISGAVFSAITFQLFDMLGIDVSYFYREYLGFWAFGALPIVGTSLVQTNPELVSKVSPIIAKVFTPIVLLMLSVYLASIMLSKNIDIYNDRDFLLIFNALLVGVMAIIVFSVVETSKRPDNQTSVMLLFCLSVVTIIVNGIALSAILFRISGGITPNRLAVLGSNILILANLLLVAYHLFRTVRSSDQIEGVKKSIAVFLPIYGLWAAVVIFLFPLIFGFE
ncbi:hypothetical protein SAMN05421780_104221 [Flexibacter flexilis DSM 6793]|uniref:DUF4153 domain-containing protein n=1 Tax=Flexibacter flexilis DSM 6793 TaxID=927664 RepID=A0A1I1I6S3_9BACT|nr:hypothetical protein [Flexibacter flexilis]SFC31512.1 hypothetical protein SAMN05421780_104221 [Flexibacter flexilis DSM 6793]